MKYYYEHKGKVIKAVGNFKHVMAISLDPSRKNGLARVIVSRKGNVSVGGFLDRSLLFKIEGNSLEKFTLTEELKIKNQEKIITGLLSQDKDLDFIGLEDPDIHVIDEKMHVYFTIALVNKIPKKPNIIALGHAEGKDLDSLIMTQPVLPKEAKELSMAPINSKGVRLNLIEGHEKAGKIHYSTVQIAKAKNMGGSWELGIIVFHPKETNIGWISGHASPGPFLPKSFIDLGKNKLLGLINGREASKVVKNKVHYGMFRVGLFIYDFELGKIDWVSPVPLIQDSKAKTITFASQFVETKSGEGIIYAHVDDSFVRAYTIKAIDLKKLLPSL